MNPNNSYSCQKPKCQESRMSCLKSRNVVGPLLCLTAVSETHPQAQPTYLQTQDLNLLCDDLRQPYDFHESCEMSCHYKEQKSPATRSGAEKCAEKRPRNVSETPVTSSMRLWGTILEKAGKTLLPEKSADPAGVGVWECFYGNASKSQEQLHHMDKTGCCQDKPDSRAIDVLGNGFLT